MTNIKDISKSTLNCYVDIISFLPFLISLFTGVILLKYHSGEAYLTEIFSLNGYAWMLIHKVSSVITISIITIHLFLHLNWLKKLFLGKLNSKNKTPNIILLVLFLLTVITAFFSWLIFDDTEIANTLRGIHNKLGIVLIVFFVIHIKHYFTWVIKKTQRIFVLNK
jgi:Domain of unknown function (DUF4405)